MLWSSKVTHQRAVYVVPMIVDLFAYSVMWLFSFFFLGGGGGGGGCGLHFCSKHTHFLGLKLHAVNSNPVWHTMEYY